MTRAFTLTIGSGPWKGAEGVLLFAGCHYHAST